MIYDSTPWRLDLLRDADLIEKWARKPHSERQQYLIEKKCFLSAFAMRKLFEARKVPDAAPKMSIEIISYPMIRKSFHTNWHRIEENFDMNAGVKTSASLEFVIKQLIHSFVFMLECDDHEDVSRFFVASEYERDRRLLSVSFSEYLGLCRKVAVADASEIHWQLDPKGGEVLKVV